ADVDAKPGTAKLSLKLTSRGGTQSQREIPFKIKTKAFRKESFNVPPDFDQMTPETLEEIRRERDLFARAFAAAAPERLWQGALVSRLPPPTAGSSFSLG